MTHVLTSRERRALEKLNEDRRDLLIKGQLVGVGAVTLQMLVDLGLAETGSSKRYYDERGWRITDDGWRCMYGKTLKEMMAGGAPHMPLEIWSWALR